jgi:hypothetical protein
MHDVQLTAAQIRALAEDSIDLLIRHGLVFELDREIEIAAYLERCYAHARSQSTSSDA